MAICPREFSGYSLTFFKVWVAILLKEGFSVDVAVDTKLLRYSWDGSGEISLIVVSFIISGRLTGDIMHRAKINNDDDNN